jgi:threonine synthase
VTAPVIGGRGEPPPALAVTLACAGCGTILPANHPFTPRCPRRRPGDDIDHVLHRVLDIDRLPPPSDPDPNPFVRYRGLFHAYHLARSAGWSDDRYVDLVRELDDAVAAVDGRGFRVTPLIASPAIAKAAGLGSGGVAWVKDETGNVGGSHKARHLFGILLELRVAEAMGAADPARPLVIASCGNAALAAAVVARAAGRELRVFVPPTADPVVVDRLRGLGAQVVACERRPGEAGDPSYLRLQEALAHGAVPFTCQGPDNGLAIEGGATLAWEIADELHRAHATLDRVVVQVGGGALASGVGLGMGEATLLGVLPAAPHLDTVQTLGAWPLARAFERVVLDLGATIGSATHPVRIRDGMHKVAAHRSHYMWPWETEPASVAHGILDDETYDWLAVVRAMLVTGGRSVVVDDQALVAANALVRESTGIDADETGTAGVAGLLALARDGVLHPGEHVAVILSGVRRSPAALNPSANQHRSTP